MAIALEQIATFMAELAQLFSHMDQAYQQVCRRFGFICKGCEHNCCLTRFHHYTVAEYLYLRVGMAQLPADQQRQIENRALDVCQQREQADAAGVMCPLNADGQCVLYAHRPMICRLHGVPHQLRRPDGHCIVGPGCDLFHARCGAIDNGRLDRTPLYAAMAQLEQRLRRHLQYHQKVKMTVAQMISETIENLKF